MIRRILVAGCWDRGPGYPRTGSLVGALRRLGFQVDECRGELPSIGGAKSALIARPWRWPTWWLASRRSRESVLSALRQAVARGPVDAVLVPYPGHLAVQWIRRCWRGPIVLDLFLSAYGTAVEDRRLVRPGGLAARALSALDRRACRAADLVLLDTPAHAAGVREQTGLAAARFDWVPVSDCEPVQPTAVPVREVADPLRVLFFGTGVPLHGLATWIEAVAAVPAVRLELIGGEPALREHARHRLAERLVLGPEFAPMREVRAAIDRSHLVAGIFGTSDKAARVVPFKLVHAAAQGRAAVTADTPVVRELLEPGVDCAVAPAGDAAALAAVLAGLAADPARAEALGAAARRRFETTFSPDAVARRLEAALCSRFTFAARARQPAALDVLSA